MSTTPSRLPGGVNHRRSQRILLSVAVKIVGVRPDMTTFEELTTTLVVGVHGAMFSLRTEVNEGQKLQLTNRSTFQDLVCTVRNVSKVQDGSFEVGVEFDTSQPRYWHVSFPPPDWTPRSPEAKRFEPVSATNAKATKTT